MRLTDNELRDINKFLQEGKPLPEKYRFLLFDDKREVELVWDGKTNEVTNVVLPFQTLEIVDEPREEKVAKLQTDLFSAGGRQVGGWTNKLIWGDNKLILSSLKNGPLREEIEKQGGIKLINNHPQRRWFNSSLEGILVSYCFVVLPALVSFLLPFDVLTDLLLV